MALGHDRVQCGTGRRQRGRPQLAQRTRRKYDKPVLFLASECNTWIGPELQAKHAAFYPNAELVVIPDTGHEMVWDNPQATFAHTQLLNRLT